MNSLTLRIIGVGIVAAGVFAAGCTDARKERLEGAQRALAALPDVEIVSSDAAAGQITVRSRITGSLSTIDLQNGPAAASSAAPATTPGASGSGSAPAESDAVMNAGKPASEPSDTAEAGLEAGATLAAGTEAASADGALPGADATPIAASATVVRDPQGRVQRIEGSGFSIERAPAATGNARAATSTGAATAAAAVPGPAAGERRRVNTPFVCSAGENRTLQGAELDVPGAGIIAERGCSLTIANVRVRAGGWGLVVNPGATVRIDDSLVEGRTGALDLYPGSSLSAWATTFRGALGRPVTAPQFIDRGGNSWD